MKTTWRGGRLWGRARHGPEIASELKAPRDHGDELRKRIEALEREVAKLQQELD